MSNGAHAWLTSSASADEFEAERQNLLDKVDICAAQKSEQHKLEWESKRRTEEVNELQKVSHADHSRALRHVESLLGASLLLRTDTC